MTYISAMPPSKEKKRFEVHLLPDAVKAFEKLAKDDKRSIKNYMEKILLDHLEQKKKKK
jgi:hypothetical protein